MAGRSSSHRRSLRTERFASHNEGVADRARRPHYCVRSFEGRTRLHADHRPVVSARAGPFGDSGDVPTPGTEFVSCNAYDSGTACKCTT
jgi:hypothetical protein